MRIGISAAIFAQEVCAAPCTCLIMSIVRLTVKGNLRHRCDKLGLEKPWNALTHNQKYLRKIAWNQEWAPVLPGGDSVHYWTDEELINNYTLYDKCEVPYDVVRPGWGSNAFFYLTHAHSEALFADVINTGGESFRKIFGDPSSKYLCI